MKGREGRGSREREKEERELRAVSNSQLCTIYHNISDGFGVICNSYGVISNRYEVIQGRI